MTNNASRVNAFATSLEDTLRARTIARIERTDTPLVGPGPAHELYSVVRVTSPGRDTAVDVALWVSGRITAVAYSVSSGGRARGMSFESIAQAADVVDALTATTNYTQAGD